MKHYKIGIVGTGMMFEYHLRAFSRVPGVRVTGCTREYYGDQSQRALQWEKLNETALKYGLRLYENYDAMLDDAEIDIIVVASINPFHREHILKAIESGKDVLAEKPVVTSLAEMDEIMERAFVSQRLVFPSHNFVYRPGVRAAKKILDSGALGTLVYSSFVSCFRSNDEHAGGWRASAKLSSGGALMDSGYHQIYQSLYLLGEPDQIQCFLSKQVHVQMEVEDFAMINASYSDGSIANIGQGHSSAFGDVVSGIRILGEKGNIVITDACYWNGNKIADDVDYSDSFFHQANYFINCLRRGAEPLSDLRDSKRTLSIILSAYDSAEKRQIIKI